MIGSLKKGGDILQPHPEFMGEREGYSPAPARNFHILLNFCGAYTLPFTQPRQIEISLILDDSKNFQAVSYFSTEVVRVLELFHQ